MTSLYEAARDLMTTVEFAIKSGDWNVDGACDPTIDLVRLREALKEPERQWVGLTEDDVHHAFNYVEMVKLLDFDRDRQAWCENFAAHVEATLRQQNGFGWAGK